MKTNFTLISIGITFVILIIFSSCLSLKPGSMLSGKKLYETFYIGENGTQYFIKPLTFVNDVDEKLEMDITFKYKNEIKDSAIVNVSLLGKDLIRDVDSIEILQDSCDIVLKDVKSLFSEKTKEVFNSRFSAKGLLYDVKKLFDCSEWNVIIYQNGGIKKYNAPKGTVNNIRKLKNEVFLLF